MKYQLIVSVNCSWAGRESAAMIIFGSGVKSANILISEAKVVKEVRTTCHCICPVEKIESVLEIWAERYKMNDTELQNLVELARNQAARILYGTKTVFCLIGV